jgi:hypothetical protein
VYFGQRGLKVVDKEDRDIAVYYRDFKDCGARQSGGGP